MNKHHVQSEEKAVATHLQTRTRAHTHTHTHTHNCEFPLFYHQRTIPLSLAGASEEVTSLGAGDSMLAVGTSGAAVVVMRELHVCCCSLACTCTHAHTHTRALHAADVAGVSDGGIAATLKLGGGRQHKIAALQCVKHFEIRAVCIHHPDTRSLFGQCACVCVTKHKDRHAPSPLCLLSPPLCCPLPAL